MRIRTLQHALISTQTQTHTNQCEQEENKTRERERERKGERERVINRTTKRNKFYCLIRKSEKGRGKRILRSSVSSILPAHKHRERERERDSFNNKKTIQRRKERVRVGDV